MLCSIPVGNAVVCRVQTRFFVSDRFRAIHIIRARAFVAISVINAGFLKRLIVLQIFVCQSWIAEARHACYCALALNVPAIYALVCSSYDSVL
jgi:hypothetical protein